MINTPISACIITLNEEHSIGACLDSLEICDEVIVVDAHSTDRTREIAAARGARVIVRDWSGYRTQKQFAVSHASHDWVLSIDADERLSRSLSSEIRNIRPYGLGQYAGYQIPFQSNYFGLPMKHGDWHREYHLRLFDRRRCAIRGADIDERVVSFGPVGRLQGHILHDRYRDIDHQLSKLGGYARIVSDAMHARGTQASAMRTLLEPAWCFLRGYILKRGFLDGWRGFVAAQTEASYIWEKYLRLYVSERDCPRLTKRSATNE